MPIRSIGTKTLIPTLIPIYSIWRAIMEVKVTLTFLETLGVCAIRLGLPQKGHKPPHSSLVIPDTFTRVESFFIHLSKFYCFQLKYNKTGKLLKFPWDTTSKCSTTSAFKSQPSKHCQQSRWRCEFFRALICKQTKIIWKPNLNWTAGVYTSFVISGIRVCIFRYFMSSY